MEAVGLPLRIARPTAQLEHLVGMYRDGLALAVLGEFRDHAGFDGVILGWPAASWQLEFTRRRGHVPPRESSGENLLVLYCAPRQIWEGACGRMLQAGFLPVEPVNPYWKTAGRSFEDPDGYRVVLQCGKPPGPDLV